MKSSLSRQSIASICLLNIVLKMSLFQIFCFISGLVFGVSLSISFFYFDYNYNARNLNHNIVKLTSVPYNERIKIHDKIRDLYNETVAKDLYSKVKILCWIMTTPANHKTKAIHVKNTWGRRCNKLIFMSSVKDNELGSVALPVHEGRDPLWDKTKHAFMYIYQHHFHEADWFLKADDDK